jgi:hypothetical protein
MYAKHDVCHSSLQIQFETFFNPIHIHQVTIDMHAGIYADLHNNQ